jgi:DNA-binding response OmpR family regulator
LYLTKPFAPQALAGEVRALLDHRGAAKAEAPRNGNV